MKDLQTYILETKGDSIDDQWLNDEKPVMTKDGRQATPSFRLPDLSTP